MPSASVPAAKKDSPAGDMSPFIIFMAFVILTTVIIMSIYRMNAEEDASIDPGGSGFRIALDAREPVVFSDDFLFPGFYPVTREAAQSSRPSIQRDIVEARRLMADGEYGRAEDLLRTLFLFYPDDLEIVYLLSGILHASGRDDEAEYYDERMFFLLPSPMPDSIPSGADTQAPETEKRTAP
ncbi:MAG: tetratricopeptide repeat protein [Lentisphaeria bacterium]|nr:tetratricopeptide repeat protein [Lentisphaeria bacterium]